LVETVGRSRGEEEAEIDRLRRALTVAKSWLDAFADPFSFVWTSGKIPSEIAFEALKEVAAEEVKRDPISLPPDESFPMGTGRISRLSRDRAQLVESHQHTAREALEVGQIAAARAALRTLRASDFAGQAQMVEGLLAVLRDSRSSEDEVSDAISRLVRLPHR
jgi:hypothetical protein